MGKDKKDKKSGKKVGKKPSDHKGAKSDSAERDAQGRRSTGSIARTRRIIGIVGNLVGIAALLVGAGAVVWLMSLTGGGNSISSVFEDDIGGTTTIAFPTLMALLSLTGFIFGQFAVRGRWGFGSKSIFSGGSFTVDLRPISAGLHAVLVLVALAAWISVVAVPVARGDELAGARDQFWFVVTVYGAITGALVAMTALSLLKKLTYNAALQRKGSSIVAGSRAQVWWRRFSHQWRAELGIGGLGGAALGLAPLGIHLDSALYGFSFAAVGIVLLFGATLLALNSWRSGLPVERVESYT